MTIFTETMKIIMNIKLTCMTYHMKHKTGAESLVVIGRYPRQVKTHYQEFLPSSLESTVSQHLVQCLQTQLLSDCANDCGTDVFCIPIPSILKTVETKVGH